MSIGQPEMDVATGYLYGREDGGEAWRSRFTKERFYSHWGRVHGGAWVRLKKAYEELMTMETSEFKELDPQQRIQNALDDANGKGGPFTKAQQKEKTERLGEQRAGWRG